MLLQVVPLRQGRMIQSLVIKLQEVSWTKQRGSEHQKVLLCRTTITAVGFRQIMWAKRQLMPLISSLCNKQHFTQCKTEHITSSLL